MTGVIDFKTLAAHLEEGGVIAYPTEGVWGLGCDPLNEVSVKKICALKGRNVEKGLVLVAANLDQINFLTKTLSRHAQAILEASCPGPDTWLIPDTDKVIPSWIKGNFVTVAVRVSQHPIVKSLCENIGLLVSTSANPSGSEPANSQQQVEAYFRNKNIFR